MWIPTCQVCRLDLKLTICAKLAPSEKTLNLSMAHRSISRIPEDLLSVDMSLQCIFAMFDAWHNTPGEDSSIPGNVLLVREIHFGRMGNRLGGMANTFQVGYCCKSKVVSLTPTMDAMHAWALGSACRRKALLRASDCDRHTVVMLFRLSAMGTYLTLIYRYVWMPHEDQMRSTTCRARFNGIPGRDQSVTQLHATSRNTRVVVGTVQATVQWRVHSIYGIPCLGKMLDNSAEACRTQQVLTRLT